MVMMVVARGASPVHANECVTMHVARHYCAICVTLYQNLRKTTVVLRVDQEIGDYTAFATLHAIAKRVICEQCASAVRHYLLHKLVPTVVPEFGRIAPIFSASHVSICIVVNHVIT